MHVPAHLQEHAYLVPAIEAIYPSDPAAFRAIYQQPNTRAPEYRLEGLTAMEDSDIHKLAEALQFAALAEPHRIDELWAAVCEEGRRCVELGL